MTGVLGYIRAVQLLLRVEYLGLATLAIPCNSFGYMASSQHGRDWDTPLGDTRYPFVVTGNQVCLRACMLIALAIARSVFYFVESPERSSIFKFPFFIFLQSIPDLIGSHRTFWWGRVKVYPVASCNKCYNLIDHGVSHLHG